MNQKDFHFLYSYLLNDLLFSLKSVNNNIAGVDIICAKNLNARRWISIISFVYLSNYKKNTCQVLFLAYEFQLSTQSHNNKNKFYLLFSARPKSLTSNTIYSLLAWNISRHPQNSLPTVLKFQHTWKLILSQCVFKLDKIKKIVNNSRPWKLSQLNFNTNLYLCYRKKCPVHDRRRPLSIRGRIRT